MNSKIFTRMLSALMAFVMILSMFPVNAFAAEEDKAIEEKGSLTITVLDEGSNTAIGGAKIYVDNVDRDPSTKVQDPFVTEKVENSEGIQIQVTIPDLTVGQSYKLTVKHADYVDQTAEITVDKKDASTEIKMTALVNVNVYVMDKEGNPVAGASVTLGDEKDPRGTTEVADGKAMVTLKKLIPGEDKEYKLTVAAPGYLTAAETFKCSGDVLDSGFEVKLTNLYDVALTVLDNKGEAVKGAIVTVKDKDGNPVVYKDKDGNAVTYETNDEGKVTLKELVDEKEYTVTASRIGYKDDSEIFTCAKELAVTVEVDRTDVKLSFKDDAEDPLDYVTVSIGEAVYRTGEKNTDLILTGLEYGKTYQATVTRNYHGTREIEFTVDDTTIKEGMTIELERDKKDIVLTVTADGEPLENADVSVDGVNVGKTDENGLFTLKELRYLQKYAVSVSCKDHDPANVEVQWKPDNLDPTPAVDLIPYEYFDIKGIVQCEKKNVEDVQVILTKRTFINVNDYVQIPVTPVDGEFKFEHVEAQLIVKIDVVNVDGVKKYGEVKLDKADIDLENTNVIEISRNSYKVTVREGSGGNVEVTSHEATKEGRTWTADVKYGDNFAIKVTANNKNGAYTHCIYALKADGVEIEDASGETSYEYTIENVTDAHNLELQFSEDTQIIIFYLDDEGKVLEKDGNSYKSLRVDDLIVKKKGNKIDVTYTAPGNFRISKVTIMREEAKEFDSNNKQTFKDEDVVIEKNHHRKYEIVVKRDRFDINVKDLTNGKITVEDKDTTPNDNKVDYNRSAVLTITPLEATDENGERYDTYLADLRIKGEKDTESKSVLDGVNYEGERPVYTLTKVKENKTVSATFKRIQMKKTAEDKVLHLDKTVVVTPGAGVYQDGNTYFMPEGASLNIKSAEKNEKISRNPNGPFVSSIEIAEENGLDEEIEVLYLLKDGVVTKSTGSIKAISDREKPAIKASVKTPVDEETGKQDTAVFTIDVNDGEGSGISGVVYGTDEQLSDATAVPVNDAGKYVLTLTNVSGTYYFRAVDNVGLVSGVTEGITVDCDSSAPVLKVDFESEWNNAYEVGGYHTFTRTAEDGTTQKNRYPKPEGLNVTIKAKDEVSEVASVTLKIGEKFSTEMERSKTADSAGFYTYTATVKPSEVTTLLVDGIEVDGESGYLPVTVVAQDTSVNQNTSSAEYRFDFYFEKNKPEIKAETVTEVSYRNQDGTKWYKKTDKDLVIVATITDEESGVNVETVKLLDALTGEKIYYPAKVKADGVSVSVAYRDEAGNAVSSGAPVPVDKKIVQVEMTIKIKAAVAVTPYDFAIEATDNEGNAITVGSKTEAALTFVIDADVPEITKVDIGAKVAQNISTEEISVELTDYGYYFLEDTTVTVYATDNDGSGVKAINFYGIAKGAEKEKAFNFTKTPEQKDDLMVAKFTVPEGFKGQIYAVAQDNVDNLSKKAHPTELTVIESQESHDAREENGTEDHVKLKLPETNVYDTKVKESRPLYTMVEYEYDEDGNVKRDKDGNPVIKKDADGKPVAEYKDGVPVEITISDTFNGIKSVKFSVTATEDTKQNIKQEEFELDNNTLMTVDGKTVTKKAKTGITWTAEKTDRNMYEKLTGTLLVKHNSNNITVKVTMTDMSDNVTTDEIKLSIDNTPPEIEVKHVPYAQKYEGGPTPRRSALKKLGETPYFVGFKTAEHKQKADYDIYENSTLQFVIRERNLKVEDIKAAAMRLLATGDLKKIEEKDLSEKLEVYGPFEDVKKDDTKVRQDAQYPYSDKTYYLVELKDCTESSTNGGTYQSSITVKDLLGNAASAQENFVIDEVAPEISIAFDNNEARNGKYYNADRTATITVRERNFNHKGAKIDGNASLDGKTVDFPKVTNWTSDSSMTTHTAKVTFSADADYTKFAATYTDLAKHSSSDSAKDFVLDKTAPVIAIEDIEDKSANNGTVAPRITYTDLNLDLKGMEISLTGVNKGEVEYEVVKKDVDHGEELTYNDFAHTKEVDDVYTLYAHAIDLAGNVTTQTISFSCNRFGSVFDLSSIKDMLGKYNQEERTIVVTETNVDALDQGAVRVTLTKNGTPVDLVAGKDFTIQVVGGEGTWHQYIYKIESGLFKDDGTYSLYFYTVDAAGNINENIDDDKEAQISFGIDKTKPILTIIDLESGKQYPVEGKTVTVEVKDNLMLQDVKIYLNEEEITYLVDGDAYIIDIPMSNYEQTLKAVATDAAGNEEEVCAEDFLITTNFFFRWYYNTPLFIGSLVLMGAMLGGLIWWFIVLLRRKKEDKEEVTG